MKHVIAALAGVLLAAGGAVAQERETATAGFVDMDGESSGSATLTDTPNGVLIELEVSGLPADQWVAFHVHETGSCEHATDHDSAGGHFNPVGAEHGYFAEGGPHAGDMPNQYVPADGVLRAQVFNSFVRLDEGDASIRGRALIVHGGQDDYETQPTGDAGDRQACAVID